MTNRTKRLGRLGNAVVPQVAEWIGSRILEYEGVTDMATPVDSSDVRNNVSNNRGVLATEE